MWRLRLGRELPRLMLSAAAVAGLAASARNVLAPPRAPAPAAASSAAGAPDRAAEGFAVTFARRYLTWNAEEPGASAKALAAYSSPAAEYGSPPQTGGAPSQSVLWAEVVQARAVSPGVHAYTVAVQIATGQPEGAGLLYLAVEVRRTTTGGLALAAYPAFVGPPAVAQPAAGAHGREVSDPVLTTVVTRALRNYLAGAAADLQADLTPGAHVSLPTVALTLQSLRSLDWLPGGGTVQALVQASDQRGVQYELGYEVEVALQQGRWEVSAVQMDPYA